MPRPSFSSQLLTLWILIAVLCGLLSVAVWLMLSSALSERVVAAKQQAEAACTAVASRYDLSMQRSGETNVDLMHAVLDIVLIQTEGIEGGFWSRSEPASKTVNGFIAYAFPTYGGSGVKRDVPEAETPLIVRALRSTSSSGQLQAEVVTSGTDAVLTVACPVPHHADLLAWTLTRARPPLGQYGERATAILASVLAVIVVLALFLALTLKRWKRNLMRLEQALAPDGEFEQGKRLERLGERDLDQIVDALNRYGERAERLKRVANALDRQLAQAERFSTLGKMAAQIAHEIRNPAGAMRLKAENALAGDGARREAALRTIIEQVGRIESQVTSLLALTQSVTVQAREVDLQAWLDDIAHTHESRAESRHVTLGVEVAPHATQPVFDPAQLARALDNLLVNALRHAPSGGIVTVRAYCAVTEEGEWLRLEVIDNGSGVSPADRERIFEPFVTGRPDGSGLGLAVVREIASAHGGRANLAEDPNMTRFVIDIPWRPS
ncbi:sensor histidine kinase [Paraburkholderia phenoliruptrix]|uniref:sensor histidine kinase n=1 Tax=Paraburkholderia phenoliruptrix TaxID=252970 RepID=UPI001C6F19D1|nr:HAMP domain-containing sensor histidine kinase [Paraburkholderia phenoliruptrix]MBW9102317.1 HAMP domain-containing histidine kinase [Paraburkholderia phenoliruptrix]MBW9127538.1 HAMP domain-containing histidine kinase [Paraburkholderia ginsengiterrae]